MTNPNDPQQSRPNPEFIDAPVDSTQDGSPSRPNLSEGATYTDQTRTQPSKGDDAKRVASDAGDRAKGVAHTAQDEAGHVKDTAKEAGGHVAETAKAEAGNVYGETKHQGKQLLDEGLREARTQAGNAQSQIAGFVRSLSDEAASLSRGATQRGPLLDLVDQADRFGHDAADWLDRNSPDDVVDSVRRYAARNPWQFLAISAGVGFVAARLVRGLKRDDSQDFESQPLRRQVEAPHSQGTEFAAPSYSDDTRHVAPQTSAAPAAGYVDPDEDVRR